MKFMPQWKIRKPADDSQTIYISEKFGVRSLHIGSDTIQSSMRLSRPYDLELAYTRSMMGFLLFLPEPRDVLMIGLGGGSVAKFMHRHMPEVRIHAVELNPEVVTIARHCFKVPDDERLQVTIGDGAEFIDTPGPRADVVMVDGYDGESQAEALSEKRFYRACHARLNHKGIMVVNLWSGDRQFTDALARIREAFPRGTLCLPAEKPGNVIVFAFRTAPGAVSWQELQARASVLTSRYALEFGRFVEALRKMNQHDEEGLVW
ncbi:MAG: polyamine aminopropyltransferase [Rhodospirillaceae bacterium]